MRKTYSSPEADIEKFYVDCVVTTSNTDEVVDPIDPGIEDGDNEF